MDKGFRIFETVHHKDFPGRVFLVVDLHVPTSRIWVRCVEVFGLLEYDLTEILKIPKAETQEPKARKMTPWKNPQAWLIILICSCVVGVCLPSNRPNPMVPPRNLPAPVEPSEGVVDSGTPALSPELETRALFLSRICAHEVMYLSRPWPGDRPFADCWAIHQVIQNRARDLHTDWEGAAMLYSHCALAVCRGDENPWTADLQSDGREPQGWPARVVRWDFRARARYLLLLAYARAIVGGTADTACDASPDHWGSRSRELVDWERAQRAIAAGRWAPVSCPGSLNAFYRVRRRARNP